jgi:hypothetical protein
MTGGPPSRLAMNRQQAQSQLRRRRYVWHNEPSTDTRVICSSSPCKQFRSRTTVHTATTSPSNLLRSAPISAPVSALQTCQLQENSLQKVCKSIVLSKRSCDAEGGCPKDFRSHRSIRTSLSVMSAFSFRLLDMGIPWLADLARRTLFLRHIACTSSDSRIVADGKQQKTPSAKLRTQARGGRLSHALRFLPLPLRAVRDQRCLLLIK